MRLTKIEIDNVANNLFFINQGKVSRHEIKLLIDLNERTKDMRYQDKEKELNRIARKIKILYAN